MRKTQKRAKHTQHNQTQTKLKQINNRHHNKHKHIEFTEQQQSTTSNKTISKTSPHKQRKTTKQKYTHANQHTQNYNHEPTHTQQTKHNDDDNNQYIIIKHNI